MVYKIRSGEYPDLNTILMRSTFKIADEDSIGTAFIIGESIKKESEYSYYVLLTAAHVLKEMYGEVATLLLRKKNKDSYFKVPHQIQIRKKGEPLWIKHPDVDISALYVKLPNDIDISTAPKSILATDEILKKYEIHPGDELLCLGFPLGYEANEAGFPILRSGKISSFPITPTKEIKTFLFDFKVFGGNSGGPVYLMESDRHYGGATCFEKIQLIVGLVSRENVAIEEIRSLTQVRRETHSLGLAVVIPASFISESLDLLPPFEEWVVTN